MVERLRISILNQSRTFAGCHAVDSIKQTIEIAAVLESLGYHRYWLSEHHASDAAHASPELLLPLVGLMTQEIRIGVAGILLRYHNSYKVAKDFRVLSGLFPQRLDLGIARGIITSDARSAFSVSLDDSVLESKVHSLLSFLEDPNSPMMQPIGVAVPQVWMLGKLKGAHSAAVHGTAFVAAMFMRSANDPSVTFIMNEYRRSFQPSTRLRHPCWAVAVGGVCAKTEERARQLASASTSKWCVPTVVGDPAHCHELFYQLRSEYETDEFVFFDMCDQHEDKITSYQLIAQELGLTSPNSEIQSVFPPAGMSQKTVA